MNNRCTLRVTGMDYHTKQLPLHCRVCGKRLMKSGQKKSTYECKGFDHECTQSLTPGEEREAAGLLKRAISTSPDQATVQLATGGTVRCIVMLCLTIPCSQLYS